MIINDLVRFACMNCMGDIFIIASADDTIEMCPYCEEKELLPMQDEEHLIISGEKE